MRSPSRGHSMCKGQEVGNLGEINEFCPLILLTQWANMPEVPNTQAVLKKWPVLSLLHSSGYPFHVCPLGNSIFKKTRGFHLDHIGNSTFSTDYSLTNVWVTDNNHTYVVSNMMSVGMHAHSMCIHFTQKFLTCLCNSFLCFPQTPRVCSQLLVFFLDW